VATATITLDKTTLVRGGGFSLSSGGWKPGQGVTVTFNSTPITLGTLTANSAGVLTGSFNVPTSVDTGSHTITLTGPATDGTSRTLSAAVTVTASTGTTLARTGADLAGLVLIGLALIGSGILFYGRREHAQS